MATIQKNPALPASPSVAAPPESLAGDPSSALAAVEQKLASWDRTLGVIGHDLRAPVTAIRMASELIMSGRITDHAKLQRIQRMMHSEIDRLSNLLSDLITIPRCGRAAAAAKASWGLVELDALCREVLETYSWLIDPKRLELCNLVTKDLTLNGDTGAIRRLIHNLIGNAAKATTRGAIRLFAEACMIDHRPFVRITVSDTGQGIDPALAGALKRALASSDRELTLDLLCSHGLGLSIVTTIAWAHGGSLSFESLHAADGEPAGTAFHVLLRADLAAPVR